MRYFADAFADTQSALLSVSDGWMYQLSANILPLTECRGGETIYLLYILFCAKLKIIIIILFTLLCHLTFYGILLFTFLRDKNR